MTSQVMTLLGAFGAMLAFIQVGLPRDTPEYLRLILGGFSAALSYYLGQTNKGTSKPEVQDVHVTVEQQPAAGRPPPPPSGPPRP